MSRRRYLKQSLVIPSMVGVSVWNTPFVNVVMLPAHAQTSSSTVRSALFRITSQQGFNFEVINNRVVSVSGSMSDSADLLIKLVGSQIKGAVRAADITMNYSQNGVPTNHSFLPDAQSGNTPFVIHLDDLAPNIRVSLELNYFESISTLEVSVLLNSF